MKEVILNNKCEILPLGCANTYESRVGYAAYSPATEYAEGNHIGDVLFNPIENLWFTADLPGYTYGWAGARNDARVAEFLSVQEAVAFLLGIFKAKEINNV